MENMIENENKELNEKNIKVIADYSAIVKGLKIVPVKFGKSEKVSYYQVALNLGLETIKVRCDEDLVRYINTCEKLKKQGFSKKELVKETSENDDKTKSYVCLKLTLANGSLFRYFISRADVGTIEIIYEDYLNKNKSAK